VFSPFRPSQTISNPQTRGSRGPWTSSPLNSACAAALTTSGLVIVVAVVVAVVVPVGRGDDLPSLKQRRLYMSLSVLMKPPKPG